MSEKLYYSMGEVAEMFDVNASLIRHWESQFSVLRPTRNKKGNRLFSPQDVEYLKVIYHLVKERGMTLEGAKKMLRLHRADNGVKRDTELMERLQRIRALLVEVREDLREEGDDTILVEEQAADSIDAPALRRRTKSVEKIAPAAQPEKTASRTAEHVQTTAPIAGQTTPERVEPETSQAADKVLDSVVSEVAEKVAAEGAEGAEEIIAQAAIEVADDADSPDDADASDASQPRRPRRKKEDAETKELFAFYEQSLF